MADFRIDDLSRNVLTTARRHASKILTLGVTSALVASREEKMRNILALISGATVVLGITKHGEWHCYSLLMEIHLAHSRTTR